MTAVDDARVETTAGTGALLVPLVTEDGTGEVSVLPPGKWKPRANKMLATGDFDGWAALCLEGDGFQTWTQLDPSNDDVEQFFRAWKDLGGQSLGESSASTRSSRSTPRR